MCSGEEAVYYYEVNRVPIIGGPKVYEFRVFEKVLFRLKGTSLRTVHTREYDLHID